MNFRHSSVNALHDGGKALRRGGQGAVAAFDAQLAVDVDAGDLRAAAADQPGIQTVFRRNTGEQRCRKIEHDEIGEMAGRDGADRLRQ